MSPVEQPTHSKDDKCCRWAPPCENAFCPSLELQCTQRERASEAEFNGLTAFSRKFDAPRGLFSRGCCCCLTGCCVSIGLKKKKKHPVLIMFKPERRPPSACRIPCCVAAVFWQLPSVAHVLTLIVVSSAPRLCTSQVTRCESSQSFITQGSPSGAIAGCEPWQVELQWARQSAH